MHIYMFRPSATPLLLPWSLLSNPSLAVCRQATQKGPHYLDQPQPPI